MICDNVLKSRGTRRNHELERCWHLMANQPDGSLTPSIAKGVKFHDGTSFTADAVFSLLAADEGAEAEILRQGWNAEAGKATGIWNNMAMDKTVDASKPKTNTRRFKLKSVEARSWPTWAWIRRHYQPTAFMKDLPLCTESVAQDLQVRDWVKDDRITLEAFKDTGQGRVLHG